MLWWGRRCRKATSIDTLLTGPKQPYQIRKKLLDVLSRLGRGLQEPTAKIAGHSGTFFPGDFAFVLFVAFIADEHEYGPMPLHLEHGLAKDLKALECGPGGNRVDEDKALTLSVIRWSKMRCGWKGKEGWRSHLTHWSRRVAYSSGYWRLLRRICWRFIRGEAHLARRYR